MVASCPILPQLLMPLHKTFHECALVQHLCTVEALDFPPVPDAQIQSQCLARSVASSLRLALLRQTRPFRTMQTMSQTIQWYNMVGNGL